jgi:hypothetical protein
MATTPKQIQSLIKSPVPPEPAPASFSTHASIRFPSPLDWKSPNSSPSSKDFVSPPQPSGASLQSPRCAEKGCVFPAASASNPLCAYHQREQREPSLFRSQQPSMLLLDRAKFGDESSEEDLTRSRDRRRLAELWEEFLQGGAG